MNYPWLDQEDPETIVLRHNRSVADLLAGEFLDDDYPDYDGEEENV